ncbi:DUF3667 domain-containing protein [Chryseobacterium sp. MYb264]|uniref:DUF3667 domain-containing protein n=1 Tax=Chryseobacterium sp. MYb264 TaxID=2745153 RepID=UPI002E143CE4|nr:DUF3667 domain-containing protein [Chryseobacterium sp. MYb264]
MSHGKLREEKTCLNCGYHVEERFCPHCGQENIETRQPFHYLFTHFIEDFTHYDGQFWKTIKYLLFRPGKLSKEYLSGKRQVYVAPVKLYIFISFVTFLLPGLLPQHKNSEKEEAENIRVIQQHNQTKPIETTKKAVDHLEKEGILSKTVASNTQNAIDSVKKADENDDMIENSFKKEDAPIMKAHNLKQYDSIRAKDGSGIYSLLRPVAKKMFEMKEKGLTKKQMIAKYSETIIHTLPKALFIYLPIFAFFLWLFHNKKKWWYFDHGIFTLHYFSFLLLAILALIVLKNIVSFLPDYTVLSLLCFFAFTALIIYMSIYFFIAHHRAYESSRTTSVFTGMLLFIVNFIGLLLMFFLLLYVSLITMH